MLLTLGQGPVGGGGRSRPDWGGGLGAALVDGQRGAAGSSRHSMQRYSRFLKKKRQQFEAGGQARCRGGSRPAGRDGEVEDRRRRLLRKGIKAATLERRQAADAARGKGSCSFSSL